MRFLMAGSDGLLVELADLETALALLDRLQAAPVEGLCDVVPAARTVLLRFDPLQTSVARLRDHVEGLDLAPGPARSGDSFEIPVRYDGADLQDVADLLGWSVETLIRRHTEAVFTVAFCGFAPGFAYMTCSDPVFDVPRRASPRVRIPAGSVALAGRFGGIYPSDGPGGWQLLGSTPVPMWDLSRPRPALLAPGDRVVFRDMAKGAAVPAHAPAVPAPAPTGRPALTVTRADHPALFQDEGRPGQAAQGVAQSGALDRAALRRLNRTLGNPRGTAAVELAFGGIALRACAAVTLALTGAPCRIELTRATGLRKLLPADQPFALDAGDCIEIGAPGHGMVSYLGLRGGFSVAPILGSAARDTLARIGPDPIGTGDTLYRGNEPAHPVGQEAAPPDLPGPGQVVPLDIVLGPRDDWFTAWGLATLTGQDWEVTQQISRSGKRLSGAVPLERRYAGELPSEPTVPGAIQVPHNGQPVLFMADHPLTGGYPVIACVADHHLDLVAQVPPGASIRFRLISKDH